MNDKFILNEIKKKLSRYNQIDKLFTCSYLSYQSIDFFKKFKETKSLPPYYKQPWLVEVFILLVLFLKAPQSKIKRSILTKEWDSDINIIFDAIYKQYPNNFYALAHLNMSESVILSMYNQQRFYQTDYRILCYRFYSILNYNNTIRKNFYEFAGAEYIDFCVLGSLYEHFCYLNKNEHGVKEYAEYISLINLLTKYKKNCLKVLSIKYEDLIELQNLNFDCNKLSSYSSCYKEFSAMPFLKDDKNYYLIAPHCVPYACTEGLFRKYTFFNKDIKDTIIAEAFEHYVYNLFINSELYQFENIKWGKNEAQYKVNKNWHKPEDVAIYKDNIMVFVECKINTTKTKTFNNDLSSLENEKNKIIDGVFQLLKNYRNFKADKYNPFKGQKINDVYLILCTFYPLFVSATAIIESLILNKKINASDKEIAFLKTHLLICDILCLESFLLFKCDIFQELIAYGKKEKMNELYFSNTSKQIKSENYEKFLKTVVEKFTELKNDLHIK